jgi:tetratricopeptide (TPR) repeat protein
LVLSKAVYTSASVSALGIAAHEVGHAVQHARGYVFVWLRTALVPVTFVSLILSCLAVTFGIMESSRSLAWAGVVLAGLGMLFQVVTLPVEFDASARARALTAAAGIVEPDEQIGMHQLLRTAALTYVARAVLAVSSLCALFLFVWLGRNDAFTVLTEGESSVWLVLVIQCLGVVWLVGQRRRTQTGSRPAARDLNDTGNLLAEQGDLTEAIAAYTKAIRLDPRVPQAYANRGAVHARTGQLDEALADLDTAIRLSPAAPAPYAARGRVHSLRKEYDAALADYDVALRLMPDQFPNVRVGQADIWLTRGDIDKAIEAYTDALEHPSSRAVALCSRGFAWLQKGHLDSALADLDESIRLAPEEAVAYNNRAVVLMKRGDYARALIDLQTAIRLNPQHPNAYKNLAWLQATCPDATFRDGSQAVANATRARQLAGGNVWLDILAAAYAEAHDFEVAVRCQEGYLLDALPTTKAEQQTRLDLYRGGQAYREKAAAGYAVAPRQL